ncbi:hypothetical protein [Alloscardovia omnicolens]|uniref:hypothetical protein n=1 Tax=Alloscardovia omnicolens TaxID=419015 RepID=UPI00254F11BF|nr:hypothetical protein [Alloscardovia omnicolens]MDK6522727.1 hypothetical protein [Alloscardovia omnicolens]
MTIHMITSRQNMAHVTADDAAHLNARIMGDGQYLLTKGWAPTLASASRVNLPVGEWLWNGRYVQISVQESINIGNGVSSGSTRDDLICLQYSRNTGTGVETVSAAVIKGVINQGIGVPPITTSLLNTPSETYMIIAVVRWNGLTPTVQAFENTEYLQPFSQTNETLRNVESRLTSLQATKSTTVRLPYQTGGAYTLTREGNIVTLGGQGTCDNVQNAGNLKVNEAIPAGYRPTAPMSVSWGGNQKMDMLVKPDGTITLLGNAYGWVHIGASWITHDPMPN